MLKQKLIDALANHGYRVTSDIVVKNGVELPCIKIAVNDDNHRSVWATIYDRDWEHETDLDLIVKKIINTLEESNASQVPFDIDNLYDYNYVKQNVFIGFQREGAEPIIRKSSELDGIEEYLYIKLKGDDNSEGTVRVSPQLREAINMSESAMWSYAEANTKKDVVIKSLSEMLGLDDVPGFPPFYVLSNRSMIKGASGFIAKDIIKHFAEEHKVNRLLILPSSIHEMLITPYVDDMNIEEFTEMVKAVNGSTVDATEQLSDKAYIVEV